MPTKTIYVKNPKLWKALKVQAAIEKTSVAEIIERLITIYLKVAKENK
jgi:hypothetical protein